MLQTAEDNRAASHVVVVKGIQGSGDNAKIVVIDNDGEDGSLPACMFFKALFKNTFAAYGLMA